MISDDDIGSFHPGMIVRECSLVVNEKDLEKAKEAIKISVEIPKGQIRTS
jgi:hypothetical protein